MFDRVTVLKIRTTCHAQMKIGLFLFFLNSVYYVHQTHDIYLVPYSVDFKAPGGLQNPVSKTVLCFISIKRPVNIWNDRKA